MYGQRLFAFEDIRRVYNFDTFVRNYRPKTADKGVKVSVIAHCRLHGCVLAHCWLHACVLAHYCLNECVLVQKQFCITQEVREVDGELRVYCRSKKAIGAKTPWSDWGQMYPSPLDLRPQPPHPPEAIPPVADNKPWEDFDEKIAPTLVRYIFRHPKP